MVGTLNPYLMQKNCLNFLHAQAVGIQKFQVRALVPEPEPPGETLDIF